MIPLALLLAVAPPAPPEFTVGPGLDPALIYVREARAAWRDEAALWEQITGTAPRGPPQIALRSGSGLRPDQSGSSALGSIALRPHGSEVLDQRSIVTLRHEMAHQLLFAACPASAHDEVFQEAFALAVSGELEAWATDGYLSVAAATATLREGKSLDSRAGRRALARLILNAPARGPLSDPLTARVRRCADGSVWRPMELEELAGPVPASGDSWVVLSRHSGELLALEGDADVPIPFGSTLKPFLLAGAGGRGPELRPRPGSAEWACGGDPTHAMGSDRALLASCNGYFLDWATRAPEVSKLGSYGPILVALGLGRLPADASEAIGLRPTLKLSPVALARAYRVLAEASPEVIEVLRSNAESGTLADLPASSRLRGLALKTGTVRDAASEPEVGWIVAVDADRVMVMTRRGEMPRSFAEELADRVERWSARRQDAAARVQVLGLVDPGEVMARCDGVGVTLGTGGPRLVAGGPFTPLESLAEVGGALCLTSPWLVRFPGGPADGRSYAGELTWSPPPPLRTSDPSVTERNRRAREGSSFILQTRLADYVAGVLDAEDPSLTGEARAAVITAVVSNVRHPRHAPRPVCDTTHCQAFKGTVPPGPGDGATIDGLAPLAAGWRPFAQGGDNPWSESRPAAEVSRVLGGAVVELQFHGGQAVYGVRRTEGEAIYDDRGELSCEAVRGPLKLPSCPTSATVGATEVEFRGVGRGHGQGLQLEALKRSGLLRDEMLRSAY